jgi:anaerobic selenocysteine-containing dehydrogenase
MERVGQTLDNSKPDATFDLMLINRRHLRDNNSWMHNSERLVKGRNRCTLLMHPADAAQRGVNEGMNVKIKSRIGELFVPAELTDKMMQGVVCLPHGYGHNRKGTRLDIAQAHAGVSVNDITDDHLLDTLTGNAVFGGVPVGVEMAGTS